MLTLPMYFLAGVIQDFLIAKYYLALTERKAILAAMIGSLLTVLTLGVFNLSFGKAWPLMAYAIGTGIGTWIGCKHGEREH